MTLAPPLPAMLRRLPAPPLSPALAGRALSALLRRIARRNPAILSRLGPHGAARFLIDVTDAPLLLLMEPQAQRMTAHRRSAPVPGHDAAIRGRLAAFLAMLHGSEDGDALFFSGELAIAGDTSAVLALRNALDDAELDLTAELEALARPPLDVWLRRMMAAAARRSGYVLSREV
ncbi:SCP2 domain-containing protein [Paracoccus sp. (in: a-proteobacteria)]|uniref:ubiquinone anaerobic biosynthesis accessory factor UbiT n=1 Tax=Paracoccus sp. TaxID=267 RepID=UPI0035B38167